MDSERTSLLDFNSEELSTNWTSLSHRNNIKHWLQYMDMIKSAVERKESNGWISVKMLIKFSPSKNYKKILLEELIKLISLCSNLSNIQPWTSLLKNVCNWTNCFVDIKKQSRQKDYTWSLSLKTSILPRSVMWLKTNFAESWNVSIWFHPVKLSPTFSSKSTWTEAISTR